MIKIMTMLLALTTAHSQAAQPPAPQAKELSADGFLFPPLCGCTGCRQTSKFGPRTDPVYGGRANHAGCDLAAPKGTEVYASADGVVTEVFKNFKEKTGTGYGNQVMIRHESPSKETYLTHYGHLYQVESGIEPGAKVKKGQKIGTVDSTGKSTGHHLHFEVLRCKGDGGEKDDSCKKVDPELFVDMAKTKESCDELRTDNNVPEAGTIER